MNKIKIVHVADFHFDSDIKKQELKDVFKNIIYFCKDKEVQILLIAGDLFDNYTLNRETLFFIEDTLSIIKNTRVFISPGNHDPYNSNSFYKLVNWPDNVYVFKGGMEKVHISELGVNVWGAGFNNRYVNESLITKTVEKSDDINLMVLHGEITNSKNQNEYNPITLEEISNSGLDYLALGHRHGFSGINKAGDTYYAYSGCPQGRGFDELGDKGIIYGYVYKKGVDLSFSRFSIRNYEEAYVDVTGSNTYEEICNAVIIGINKESRKTNLYKINLVGEISSHLTIDEEILSDKLSKDFYSCKIKDKTKYSYNLDEIVKGYSIKSIFVKKLLSKLEQTESDEEKEIIMEALNLGIASLSDEEATLNDY